MKTIKVPTGRAERAKFYCVTIRTLATWAKLSPPAPVHDVAAMIQWAAGRKRLSDACRSRLEELRREIEGDDEKQFIDPDWLEFQKLAASKSAEDGKASLSAIQKARDFSAFKYERAAEANDRDAMRFHKDMLVAFESAYHDAVLRARKLNLDTGEVIPRCEIERIVWAWAFWAMQSTNKHCDALSKSIAALAPGADTNKIYDHLQAELLGDRFLTSFVRASQIKHGTTVPSWIVAEMRRACGDFLEKGEAAFDAELEKLATGAA